MHSTIITQPDHDSDSATTEQDSLIDIESEHFTTVIVLLSSLKQVVEYDPSQETNVVNGIWRMVENENISLGAAMEFVASQPKPVPRSKRVLDAWWKTTTRSQ